jgi:hypothetical protein
MATAALLPGEVGLKPLREAVTLSGEHLSPNYVSSARHRTMFLADACGESFACADIMLAGFGDEIFTRLIVESGVRVSRLRTKLPHSDAKIQASHIPRQTGLSVREGAT